MRDDSCSGAACSVIPSPSDILDWEWSAMLVSVQNDNHYLVSKIVLRTSKIIATFDRIVINDTGVDGLASLIPFSSLRLKQIQTGKVSTYLMSMTLGLIAALLYIIFFH